MQPIYFHFGNAKIFHFTKRQIANSGWVACVCECVRVYECMLVDVVVVMTEPRTRTTLKLPLLRLIGQITCIQNALFGCSPAGDATHMTHAGIVSENKFLFKKLCNNISPVVYTHGKVESAATNFKHNLS